MTRPPKRPSKSLNLSRLHLLANAALQNNLRTKIAEMTNYFDTLDIFHRNSRLADRFMEYLWSPTTDPRIRAKHLDRFARIRFWAATKGPAIERRLFAAYDKAFLKRLQKQKPTARK